MTRRFAAGIARALRARTVPGPDATQTNPLAWTRRSA
jgi:hypothetical protein